jgi:Ni,Fe-hydrogenase I cytochrome b subunit
MYLALAILMGITGLAMLYQKELSFVFDFGAWIGSFFGTENGYAVVRLAHRIGMFLFLMVMIIHAYAVIIFEVLGSMITGKRAERVKRE